MYPIFKKSACNKIENILKDMTKTGFNEFKKFMSDSCVFLSGSSILSCVSNADFEFSDLDFYIAVHDRIPDNINTPIITPFESHLINNSKIDHKDNEIYVNYTFMSTVSRIDERIRDINHIKYYNGCEGSDIWDIDLIKIISLKDEPSEIVDGTPHGFKTLDNFVNTMFDLNICRNYFYYDENGEPNIFIANLNAIYTKNAVQYLPNNFNLMSVSHKKEQIQSMRVREHKYRERGFEITQHQSMVDFLKRVDLHYKKVKI
jgi:hypothetical protein